MYHPTDQADRQNELKKQRQNGQNKRARHNKPMHDPSCLWIGTPHVNRFHLKQIHNINTIIFMTAKNPPQAPRGRSCSSWRSCPQRRRRNPPPPSSLLFRGGERRSHRPNRSPAIKYPKQQRKRIGRMKETFGRSGVGGMMSRRRQREGSKFTREIVSRQRVPHGRDQFRQVLPRSARAAYQQQTGKHIS